MLHLTSPVLPQQFTSPVPSSFMQLPVRALPLTATNWPETIILTDTGSNIDASGFADVIVVPENTGRTI